MHCQKDTAEKVIEKGADYVSQVKDNQRNLRSEIAAYFHKERRDNPAYFKKYELKEVDGEHGRIVERQYAALAVNDWLDGMEAWPSVKSLVEITRTQFKVR